MKIRNGFVSNSSSCSFTINKRDLADWQLEAIRDHIGVAIHVLGWGNETDSKGYREVYFEAWGVEENDSTIGANTTMDNFDMEAFLAAIGLISEVEWEEHQWGDTSINDATSPVRSCIAETWNEKESEMLSFSNEHSDLVQDSGVHESIKIEELPFELIYCGVVVLNDGMVTTNGITSPDTDACYFHFRIRWNTFNGVDDTICLPDNHIITDGAKWALTRVPDDCCRTHPFICLDKRIKLHRMILNGMGTEAQQKIIKAIGGK